MAEPIKDKLTRWSLERVQFLLSHLEGFVDHENKDLRERALHYVVAGGLDQVQNLVEGDPSDPRLPHLLLEALSAFFESGLLIQRGPAQDTANWWATDLICRGNLFHLELQDQVLVAKVIPEMTPLQVHRAPAGPLLEKLKLEFLLPGPDAEAFLLRPTPTIAYLLVTNLAAPWSVDHVTHAQRLINKCFLY